MVRTDPPRVWIPKVPRMMVRQLALRIKPVVDFGSRGKCYIKPVDLFNVAYTWAPIPAEKAPVFEVLCDITTYHSYGAPVFFKPSIAEVLAQIPAEYRDVVVAFEIDPPGSIRNMDDAAFLDGYHSATTRLYVLKSE
ncbi:MAG: hypothetical protein UZ21_OP11001001044 [Microgenomates bacterium OLB22]|nr:MAG: hypothetical protein UZ21_OP11001001044 [Microgenomates bacterium OLB22]